MSNPTHPKNTIISRRLRQARQSRDLSQDRLGVMAGLEESSSSARMSRYESGIHEPTYQFVEAIAKVLGISPAFFYCADDRLAEIILIYSGLSETKRKALLQQATKITE
ncbi:helix-turn-helix domain-containing protein [Solimicrobium silvestre]|uniref:Helix-turn-helix domain n=1 Tax=Solimicrobium silvestre TaxID=2099400 RepID=A0A2S9GT48_9BURK|nr:helix-turn-helix transcriptional regulator [Solimicrobium silvestre]PRC90890.1 Helix-turn-helix domain [Solimicrobium silvestre]